MLPTKKLSRTNQELFIGKDTRPLETLSERFYAAVNFLKKTSINRQQNKIKLDGLPWHLVLGQKNSGKTALLANSEVSYVLSKKTKHLASSRHCDWWVTPKIVLLDVPGSYLTRKGQLSFLELLALLEKTCTEETVRSILLVVNVDDIITHDKENLHLLRRRILSLQKTLNASIPLYVIVNHSDKIPGFLDFFSNITQEERKNPWGILFNFFEDGKNNFKKRFQSFIHHLNDQLVWRLQHENDLDKRLSLTEFPGHMHALETPLYDFLRALCCKAPDYVDIDIKGIFFTSATDNNALGALMHTNDGSVRVSKRKHMGYFIHGIITQFLPNHPLANQVYKKNWFKSSALLTATAIVLIITSVWVFDFYKHTVSMLHVEKVMQQYQTFVGKNENPSLDEVVILLNSFITTWETLQSDTLTLPFNKQIFQNSAVEKTLMMGLNNIINNNFFPLLTNLLENKIQIEIANKQYIELYNTLVAYLMLDNPKKVNSAFLATAVKPFFAKPVDEQITRSVFTVLLKQAPHAVKLNKELIAKARNMLLSLQAAPLGFIILENQSGISMQKPIFSLPENSWLMLNPSDNTMPTFFTAKARERVLTQDIADVVETSLAHNWVLNNAYGANDDKVLFSKKLRGLYLSAYSNHWGLILSQIKPVKPKTLKEAQMLYKNLSESLLVILKTLRDNTQFSGLEKINPALTTINALITPDGLPTPELMDVLRSVQYVSSALTRMTESSDINKAVFDFAEPLMNKFDKMGKNVVLIDASKLPEPIKEWITTFSAQTWTLIVNASIGYVTVQENNKMEREAAKIPSILDDFKKEPSQLVAP